MRSTAVPSAEQLEAAVGELGMGARATVEKCCGLLREGRMSDSDLEELLRSFAWQSRTLRAFFAQVGQKRARAGSEAEASAELLSAEDMAALMDSDTPVHKANKHSACSVHSASSVLRCNGEHMSESDSDRTHTGACVQSEEAASAARPHYEDDALQAVFVRRCQSRKLLPLLPMAKKVHQENSIQRFDQLSLHSVAVESDAWLASAQHTVGSREDRMGSGPRGGCGESCELEVN